MRRTRYQQGNLQLAERKRGPRAWEYRWYESLADGSRKRRSLVVGSVEQYPNEASAKRAVASLLVNINAESPRFSLEAVSVQTLVEHYREKELGKDSNKTFATCETYQGYFRKWILPRWGNYRLKDVKSVAVEEWLRSLDLSNGSKAKIRNIMHAVFNHAVRWEWHDRNPITHVRQSAKRKSIPTVLTLAEVEELLLYLEEPTHTAVLVDVMTGLRVGELLALKWQDIDFEKFEISVTRSISLQHVGECKTEASRKPVPLDSRLAEVIVALANSLCLPATGGLGLCQSTRQRNTAVLAGNAQPLALATGSEGRRNPGPDWLAHFPAHIRDSSQSEWGGCQDCAGTIAARK